ncbi:MAG: inositol monophosphatase [Deltaproteobacteria bacterium]|nr:inositol monophosphatase [Deltaproteobacteria bacterium]
MPLKAESPAALLDFAEQTARKAGEKLVAISSRRRKIEQKGIFDLVTDGDRASERIVARAIAETYPHHGLLAEEGSSRPAAIGDAAGETIWVVDPLDGTTNYAHRFPYYCVSIACLRDGEPVAGVVFDPVRDEMFSAHAGVAATMNGRAISVSKIATLEGSLLATGFPYDRRTTRHNNFDHHEAFTMASGGVRRAGAAALDICYVACGRLDGFWELSLKPWDVAAAAFIATRAGGRATDFGGRRFDASGKTTVVSNGRIHGAMIRLIAKTARIGEDRAR